MTHGDAGHYAAKRRGVELNQTIAESIKEKASDHMISCADAHAIAAKLGVEPADVGTAIDLLEIRIHKCQLGLFGHEEQKNIPALSDRIKPDIEWAIQSSLINGRLPCLAAWQIAQNFSISKTTVSAACETMKIKISACQLGAFG
ncbi:MAG: hypothetical protein A4E57_03891 [Syntrophorhabdaceae bacterium PtaU1.Bin034]|nr:MAG: hypothetical protein A4E57_03891 [Syntrophorhabdaceae bacterium PtaU1.Bin034]